MDITSRKNPRVVHFKKLAASTEYRRACGEYVCDGEKLLREAVQWGADIREVMAVSPPEGNLPADTVLHTVTYEVLEAASPMKTPQNVVFTVGIPPWEPAPDMRGAVILENLQDPGNVGTVLRSAGAFEAPLVTLVGECADVYSPKTVRASMGAVFRQRLAVMTHAELAAALGDVPLYGAALRRDARDIRDVDLSRAAVAIGNEGAGLSPELLALCAGTVIIPMGPRCESLNAAVAASLAMWERFRRQA